jgi:GNAT superfamily N-acetyltransferase
VASSKYRRRCSSIDGWGASHFEWIRESRSHGFDGIQLYGLGYDATVSGARRAHLEAAVAVLPLWAIDGLSPRAGYQRLMSPRKPSDAELRRWTDIDPTREGALVAIASSDGEARQIGVARYAMEPEGFEAEFAIVLSDDWQGRGLGAHLLSRLIDVARRSGIKRVLGTTLSENQGMLALARRLGFKLSRDRGSAFVTMMSLTLGAEA